MVPTVASDRWLSGLGGRGCQWATERPRASVAGSIWPLRRSRRDRRRSPDPAGGDDRKSYPSYLFRTITKVGTPERSTMPEDTLRAAAWGAHVRIVPLVGRIGNPSYGLAVESDLADYRGAGHLPGSGLAGNQSWRRYAGTAC
jgi:hypothetical protein